MAKTLLQLVRAVSEELQLPAPNAVLSSQDLTVKQLRAFVEAACAELAEAYDWQALLRTHTFTTVPAQSTYALPTDFLRQLSNTAWDRSAAWPMQGNDNPQLFQALQSGITTVGPYSRFRIAGNLFELLPVPQSAINLAFNYISSSYALDGTTGAPKVEFTTDSDTTVFRDRLVINFTKLKWLQSKGFDTTTATQDFNTSYTAATGQDVPASRLMMGAPHDTYLLSGANVKDGSWS